MKIYSFRKSRDEGLFIASEVPPNIENDFVRVEEIRPALNKMLVMFLDDIRDYQHESSNNLAFDDRDSQHFVDVFLTSKKWDIEKRMERILNEVEQSS